MARTKSNVVEAFPEDVKEGKPLTDPETTVVFENGEELTVKAIWDAIVQRESVRQQQIATINELQEEVRENKEERKILLKQIKLLQQTLERPVPTTSNEETSS
jgi:hypothetical protein